MCLEHQTHLDMFGAIALMSAIRITGLHTVNILTHKKGTGDHRQSENNYHTEKEDILYIVYRLVMYATSLGKCDERTWRNPFISCCG